MAKRIAMMACAFTIAALAGVALVAGRPGASRQTVLAGNDLGRLRHEALRIFPRGEAVTRVETGLKDLGFQCAPRHRPAPNINAASVECDSAGRGYPTALRMEVTVLARNGTVSDIAISHGLDGPVADARTPNPPHSEKALPPPQP